MKVDIVRVLAVSDGLGGGESGEYVSCGLLGLFVNAAFADDIGYLLEIAVVVLLWRSRFKSKRPQAGPAGLANPYLEAL
jgi:hypothetical protein